MGCAERVKYPDKEQNTITWPDPRPRRRSSSQSLARAIRPLRPSQEISLNRHHFKTNQFVLEWFPYAYFECLKVLCCTRSDPASFQLRLCNWVVLFCWFQAIKSHLGSPNRRCDVQRSFLLCRMTDKTKDI